MIALLFLIGLCYITVKALSDIAYEFKDYNWLRLWQKDVKITAKKALKGSSE